MGLMLAITLGCGPQKKILHIYNWADYIRPELVTEFEQKDNCRVMIDYFESNESMYAKLKAGATGYDLVFPSSYMAAIMQKQSMLQSIDHTMIPNIQYIDRQYLAKTQDKTMTYSVPYMISFTGIGYNTEKVQNVKRSWAMFDRPEYKGRMVLLNDMRETIGAALRFLGYSVNTLNDDELGKARDVVIRWKKNIAKFEVDESKRGLAANEFWLVHNYSGDIIQVMEENDKVDFFIPEEGTIFACDDMVIPVDAKETELAHRFIDFMHDPQVCARNIEFIYYMSPNTEAKKLLSEELRNNQNIFPKKPLWQNVKPF
jgi:spermidine/putrescine transport system substrate-binding protein